MTTEERKKMIVKAIRMIEDRLLCLRYCEYDGAMDHQERESEIETLQNHLHCAHSVLVILNEEELGLRSA